MFTIKVVSKNSGKVLKGKKVSVVFDGFFRGVSGYEYTDGNGEAYFDNDPGNGKVILNGSTIFKGRIEGRVVVYI